VVLVVDQWLYTHLAVAGDPLATAEVFRKRAPRLLRDGLSVAGMPDRSFGLEAHLNAGGAPRLVQLSLRTGTVELHGSCLRLPLEWEPTESGTFAPFEGGLEFEVTEDGRGELCIFGRYRLDDLDHPPAAAMEATRATARRLLRGLASELGRIVPGLPWPPTGETPLRVADLMTPQPITLHEDTPLPVASLVLLREQVGGVPVLNTAGDVVGVLSESDLLAREAAPRRRSGIAARYEQTRRRASTAGEACTRPPLTVSPEASVREAARMLLDADVGRLVVIGDHGLAGVLSRHDVLRALARSPAQLLRHVEAALDAEGVHEVRAEVLAAGMVRLTGQVRHRSSVAALEHAIWAVDGVADVRNELTWADDDTLVLS
jgi:CBS domain-containing protein